MVRRPTPPLLNCECLEARDVPAVILNAAFNAARTDIAPLGGSVVVSEVRLATTDALVTRAGTTSPRVTKLATANDTLTFSLSGTTLTITSADGIFGRIVNSNTTTTQTVNYGTTLVVNGVSTLTVDMPLGGNDIINENVNGVPVVIGAGPGSDQITSQGPNLSPALAQFLVAASVTNPALIPSISTLFPPKALNGGDGDDTLSVTGFAIGYTLDGGNGNDQISVPLTSTLNSLVGGAGNDNITGGLGTELIIGGAGNDILIGNGGRDIYIVNDVELDLVVGVRGDIVSRDPFDISLLQ